MFCIIMYYIGLLRMQSNVVFMMMRSSDEEDEENKSMKQAS